MERRLGRGLGALLPDSARTRGPVEIDLDSIRPNPHQPREVFRPAGLEELRQSIVNHGVLQPVVVRKAANGYELVSGERRWRAARLAGLRTVPAVVRANVSDDDMLELALVENLQRQDLDPMERARGFRQMMERLGLTQEKVAGRVGLQRSTVANHIRLLELPEPVQQTVSEGSLSMGHARALLALPDRQRLLDLASEAVARGLSVREVERLVRQEVAPESPPANGRQEASQAVSGADSHEAAAGTTPVPQPPWVRELEARMQEFLGSKVRLKNGENYRGQIVVDYYGRDDLERLIGKLTESRRL